MKRDVFISYHSDVREEAYALRDFLKKKKISCWMAPDDLPGVREYADEITDAIEECIVFLLVLSEQASDSVWLLKELDAAVNMEKIIMPFNVNQCDVSGSVQFYLADVEAYGEKENREGAMQRLAADIKRVTERTKRKSVKPWFRFGPYKKLSDGEEYLAMNSFTVGWLMILFWWLCTVLDLSMTGGKAFEALLATLFLFIPWYLGGIIARKVGFFQNKWVVVFCSFVSALVLSAAALLFGLLVVILIAY